MEAPGVGITFAVQWKKKPGVNNREDETSIGLWDSTLTWPTFKSYVSQNMGTSEGIAISYVDSDGDEISIGSECEFQEFMKYAKKRSVQRRATRLHVERVQAQSVLLNVQSSLLDIKSSQPDGKLENAVDAMFPDSPEEHAKPSDASSEAHISFKSVDKGHKSTKNEGERGRHRKGNFVDSRSEIGKTSGQKEPEFKLKTGNTSREIEAGTNKSEVEFKLKTGNTSHEIEAGTNKSEVEMFDQIGAQLKDCIDSELGKVVDQADAVSKVVCQLENMNLCANEVPVWFERYMHQMKSEIVAEVTTSVMHGIKQALAGEGEFSPPLRGKNRNKKKSSDEDSSDGALSYEPSRDHKLLKKIEKLHKREKKLEKKLDTKLEKLENKTKRMMEKRSHSKARCERNFDKTVHHALKRKSGDYHVNTYLMDAILLDGPTSEVYVNCGEKFTKGWEIMNAGTIPWTDKTELRLAWGTTGLEPETTVVKCPILLPGEEGIVYVRFKAPVFFGTFKSYWHFYHMGDRFGHWIGCTVVVKEPGDQSLFFDNVQDRNIPVIDLTGDTEPESDGNEGEMQQELKQEAASECDSDAESDHFSRASPHGTVSSDTDDENFVVVHMPSCFVCDAPEGEMDTIPVVMKNDTKKTKQEASEIKILNREDTRNDTNQNGLENGVEQGATANHEETKSEYEYKPPSKVYAVDCHGQCISVSESHAGSSSGFSCGTRDFRSSSAGSSKNEPGPEQKTGNDAKSEATFPENGEKSNFHSKFQHSTSAGSATGASQHSTVFGHDDPLSVIHILPETLVSSAVNAASSAFNAARTVIGNLRSPQGGDGSDCSWQNLPRESHMPMDRTTAQNLQHLLEMGFTNCALNVLLLQRYNNDLLQVIGELLCTN